MTAFDFFSQYWWLIFVFFWPVMGMISHFNRYNHRTEMLKMLKSYADQGKEPPAALVDAMKSDDRRYDDDDDHYYRRRWRRHRGGGWSGAIAFLALAAGFGYAGQYANLDGHASGIFTALAIGFGIGAAAMLVMAIIRTLTTPRFDPRDYDERK